MAHDIEGQIQKMIESLTALVSVLNKGRKGKLKPEDTLHLLCDQLQVLAFAADPIRQPPFVFDPSDPELLGRITACVLLLQSRLPMESIRTDRVYGSGIYAIYYNGDFAPYKPLSGSETPIYVGKADPTTPGAPTPRLQGDKLTGRLAEHARSISRADNLAVEDFEYRYLVVKSGMQKAAEDYLIHYFRPIWNKEMRICYGIGKHGDSAETRANKRSPWDVMHAGRDWAAATVEDQKSCVSITEAIRRHFAAFPPLPHVDFRKLLMGQVE